MGCRPRSSRQANEAEIVSDVQCSSYAELPTARSQCGDTLIGATKSSGNFRALRNVHTFAARCILLPYSEDKFAAPKFPARNTTLPAAQWTSKRKGPIRTHE